MTKSKRKRKPKEPTLVERTAATSSRADIKMRLMQVHELLQSAVLMQVEDALEQARQLGSGEPQLEQLLANIQAVRGQAWFLAQSVNTGDDDESELVRQPSRPKVS